MLAAHTTAYGAPDVLTLTTVPAPTAGPGQILVDVYASPVTYGDRRLRSADFPGPLRLVGLAMFGFTRPRNPIQGSMFAGRVVAVGDGVTRFAVGDDVFGEHGGAYAEQIALKADGAVARMPEGLSHAEAAALPYGAGTALVFLRDLAALKPGERLLVVGAAGGVGRYAIQVAKHLGAHVTAVCSGRSAALVRDLGADAVVDRHREDPFAQDTAYDVVFDTVGVVTYPQARRRLSAAGRFVSLHASTHVMWSALRTALFGGPRAITGVAMPDATLLAEIAAWATTGILRPHVVSRFPLADIATAHATAEAGGLDGEVIVTVHDAPALRAVG